MDQQEVPNQQESVENRQAKRRATLDRPWYYCVLICMASVIYSGFRMACHDHQDEEARKNEATVARVRRV